MAKRRLTVTRAQVLAFRRRSSGLDDRLAPGEESLRAAAWAGLQDSMPRAALLSIHARVENTKPGSWEDPSLVQVWGPRFSVYVVAECDRAVFTVARLPDDPVARGEMDLLADQIEAVLDGRRMSYRDVGRALERHPNSLRYAAPTGRLAIRWDGGGQPTIWGTPPPALDPVEARLELGRRYLHVFGPSTADAFAEWAGIKPARGLATFDALAGSLTPVRTPVGDGWILSEDEQVLRTSVRRRAAPARLLPSGDTYFLLQGTDRELLVPDPDRRRQLWTVAGLAGCRGGRRRSGRDVATRRSGRHDRDLGSALAGSARRRSNARRSRFRYREPRAESASGGRRDAARHPASPRSRSAAERPSPTGATSRPTPTSPPSSIGSPAPVVPPTCW